MSAPIVSARAVRGELRLRAERDATGKTVLADRHAAGAFHLSKPYWDGRTLMVQWINPTAGIFAGDVLESDVRVGECASLLLTTPSATRIHTRIHAATPPGEQRLHFHVANGGFLEVQSEWLIPQKKSAFQQFTTIELDAEACLFFTELIAPGRVAHGETLAFDALVLGLRLKLSGKLALQERLCVKSSEEMWKLKRRDGAAQYLASLLVVSPAIQHSKFLESAAQIAENRCQLGMTMLRDDLVAIRLAGESPMSVRKTIGWLRSKFSTSCGQLKTNVRKL